jgi:hypothetical protein
MNRRACTVITGGKYLPSVLTSDSLIDQSCIEEEPVPYLKRNNSCKLFTPRLMIKEIVSQKNVTKNLLGDDGFSN